MKLVGLTGLLLFFFLKLLECRWKLGQLVAHIGDLLVYLLEFFGEELVLGLQITFGFLHLRLGLSQRIKLSMS